MEINNILKWSLVQRHTQLYTFTEIWPNQSYAMEVKHEQLGNKVSTEL
jgi:hypothetical protein